MLKKIIAKMEPSPAEHDMFAISARIDVQEGDWNSYMACLDQINDPEQLVFIIQRFGSVDGVKRVCAADYVGGQLRLDGPAYAATRSRVFTPDALSAISASNRLRRTNRQGS